MMRSTTLFFLSLLVLAALAMPIAASAQVSIGIGIHIGPPALPVYAQPVCPGVGYIWTPGYWAYGDDGYFWVPGTWVLAPTPGYLWTPGYWGWGGGVYLWHAGYWGPHVGFYGGISYGYGYTGSGFYGGEWRGGVYHYNTAVTNVNTTVINNTYNTTVVNNNTTVNRTSYNGGTGGVTAQPTAAEQAAANEHHLAPTPIQTQHQQAASTNRALLASENHGTPPVAATTKPGAFTGPGVVAAKPVQAIAATTNRPNGSHSAGNSAGATKTQGAQSDRPPSAHTTGANGAKTMTSGAVNSANPNHPAHTNTSAPVNNTHPHSTATSTSHLNNSHPNNKPPSTHQNTSHPSTPPKPQSHPSEPHGGKGR